MLTLEQLDRCRRGIDETSLALYQLIKALREDVATIEKDIEWNKKIGLTLIVIEMTKKRDQMLSKIADYDHLKECCDKAVENIRDTEKWTLAMK